MKSNWTNPASFLGESLFPVHSLPTNTRGVIASMARRTSHSMTVHKKIVGIDLPRPQHNFSRLEGTVKSSGYHSK